ncbi:MAG: response regulator [bacterium]|nr:response regulator [bacterium]
MYKAVVIDDEKNSRELVVTLLDEYFRDIKIVGEAKSAIEGIKLINNEKPDLVFLDIEMPDGTGFDVLDALPERNFQFMFITSYSHYAIKAFKYSATDYITKPIDDDEFVEAVTKLKNNFDLNPT